MRAVPNVFFALRFHVQILLIAAILLGGCATSLESVRPVSPDQEPEARLRWPDYVEAADIQLLIEAEKRIEEVRKGELLVKVVDVNGDPVEGAQIRWIQSSRDVSFGVEGSFEPGIWGDLVRAGVDQTAATLDWQSTEPEAGVWTTGPTAAIHGLDILPAMGVRARASAAVWMVPERTPDWVRRLDQPALLKAVDNHVRTLANQLEGFVSIWEVLRDPNTEWASAVGGDPELVAEVAATATLALRDVDPSTPVLVNFAHPFGEDQYLSPLHFGQRLAKKGVDFELVGLQYLYNGYTRSRTMPRRSLTEISQNLDELGLLNKPIHVTAVAAPSEQHPMDPTLAGHWGRRWTPELQAVYLEAFYIMALANPDVRAITWQGARDLDTDVVGGGLFEQPGKPRAAFYALRDLISRWHTEGRATVDQAGQVRFRGYAGDYRVVVTEPRSGREVTVAGHITERELDAVTITLSFEMAQPEHLATPWVVLPRTDLPSVAAIR